ncbi:MAG: SRPBCC domain-containing protein [Pseudomonadota bacterium]|jgi:hypothetical protein|uniref:SRPBCC family protein n=1 Tax=Thalassovita sp. TaxID=1979401 RepID=UPI002AB20F00|nr:SRPBCC domain-containing protein [Thalassovita sp.]MEC7965544.1 SRPBCC domain-containing protein [Pseudomonadota bacterium]MEC8041144.1 SRPBCC domain-containing protein [Pseudomonadota bacterium]MEC8295183.1 SRPBCC domain-containing protein [Pseudomonadota bacterium]
MNFSAKEDVDVSIDHVFAMMTDFSSFETAALRRGVEVQRQDMLSVPGVGMEWDLKFHYRGKLREVALRLVEFDPPNAIRFRGDGQGMAGKIDVDLVAMSPERTRISIDVELEANNLAARLVLQSLKLARTKMNKAFHTRVAAYATQLEDRFRQIS